MSLEKPKLALEYVKVLIWPIVILLILAFFSPVISQLGKKTENVEAEIGPVKVTAQFSGTGKKQKDDQPPITTSTAEPAPTQLLPEKISPEMWFDIRPLEIPKSECLSNAAASLKKNGFLNGDINQGTTAYGYTQEYAGAFWCSESPPSVLVVVSGPSSKIASEKVTKLVDYFESGSD